MNDTVIVQPVESPVICKPYYEPTQHYEYDRASGRATIEPGRRPAAYWYKLSEDEAKQQQRLTLHYQNARGDAMRFELDEGRRDLTLVNKLREDVRHWRESGYEGATNVTRDLLRHWWRKDRLRRMFFCQMEATETIIFLNEIRGIRRDGSRGKPRWTPKFTDADFDSLIDQPFEATYAPLTRMCCKMATGRSHGHAYYVDLLQPSACAK
jgi:type III restriction enzyme